MRLAHLILCHTSPEQVNRLVSALQHMQADIYIHVDKKVPLASFSFLKNRPGVYLIEKRVNVYWGGYSIVEATLNGFRQILGSGKRYSYINLLSGQDYPLKPAAEIHRFFADNPGNLFMNIFPEWTHTAEHENRMKQYYFAGINIRGKYTAERIMRMVKPRKFPEGFTPVGRSQWFTIPPECAAYLINYIEDNKAIVRLFRYMWAPDELLFHSVLYNSHYQSAITNDNMRYVDWSAGEASPKVLTMDDAQQLAECGQLFARKFDVYKDIRILDHIDNLIRMQ